MALTKITGEGVGTLAGDTTTLTLEDTSSHSANTGPAISFKSKDSGGTTREVAKIVGESHSGSNEGNLAFQTLNSGTLETKWKVFKNGNLLPSNSSYGIYLGTSSAGDANLFNDYEEGNWTPTVSTATGYSNQTGRYTKIGRIVHLMFNIQTSSTSAATNQLQGLPFASANTGQSNGAVSIGYYSNLSTSFTWISGYLPNNSSIVYFSGNSANNATIQHNTVNVFAGTSRMLGTIIYQTAD